MVARKLSPTATSETLCHASRSKEASSAPDASTDEPTCVPSGRDIKTVNRRSSKCCYVMSTESKIIILPSPLLFLTAEMHVCASSLNLVCSSVDNETLTQSGRRSNRVCAREDTYRSAVGGNPDVNENPSALPTRRTGLHAREPGSDEEAYSRVSHE